MLRDHRYRQQRRAEEARRNRRNAENYGRWFIENQTPDWFTTFTFEWQHPSLSGALDQMKKFVRELEHEAGHAIGVVLASDHGALGYKLHFHGLIFGVAELNRSKWWSIAKRRFGRAQILRYEPALHGERYIAKNGLSDNGDIYFLGSLFDSAEGR